MNDQAKTSREQNATRRFWSYALASLLLCGPLSVTARADGTETLGPPSIEISQGSGVVAAGIGLGSAGIIRAQRGTVQPAIVLDVPGTRVNQALLYWSGEGSTEGDDELVVDNGGGPQTITGTLIGGPTEFFSDAGFGKVHLTAFRADVTDLVTIGLNTLTIDSMDFGFANSGAGLLVIYDDGTTNDIAIRDGQDLAFARFTPPLDTTVPQIFTFPPSENDRTGMVKMFFGSVGTLTLRPSLIRVSVEGGAVAEFPNILASVDGPLWDTVRLDVDIPAGSTSLTMQVLSVENGTHVPASLSWIAATLMLDQPGPCEFVDCDDSNACTDDFCNPETGECEYTQISCDDGDACTEDTCDPASGCIHTDITPTCDDGVECTINGCDPAIGCTYSPDDTQCGDSNACTNDTCDLDLGCVHTPDDTLCNDDNACTSDTCHLVDGCVYTDISNQCVDGNVCTSDRCDPAVGCVYDDISAVCADDIPCTTDTCDPTDGCINTPDDTLCNDDDACTSDTCDEEQGCVYEDISAQCDDNNVCTTDSCDPAVGCVYTDISDQCDDGVECTVESCDPETGCTSTPDNTLCNDNDACTSDTCDAVQGCVYVDISLQCDDDNACTADRCDPAQGCVYDDISATCNDGVACTNDRCDPATGCVNVPDNLLCNDNDVCTRDVCTLTGCQYTDSGICQACCVADDCFDITIDECELRDGIPQGIGTTCDTVTCTACGNGRLDPGEECDFGGADDACPGQCMPNCMCPLDQVPTMSTWGTIILTLMLLAWAKIAFGLGNPNRRRSA